MQNDPPRANSRTAPNTPQFCSIILWYTGLLSIYICIDDSLLTSEVALPKNRFPLRSHRLPGRCVDLGLLVLGPAVTMQQSTSESSEHVPGPGLALESSRNLKWLDHVGYFIVVPSLDGSN